MESEADYWLRFWHGMMGKYGYAVTGFTDLDDPTINICENDDPHPFDRPVELAGTRYRRSA